MQDLIDRLGAELGRIPEPTFDVAATVATGRKVVRRRRLAAGGAALAAVLVVGGAAALTAGGDGRARDGNVAGDPTPTPSVKADPGPASTPGPWGAEELLRIGDPLEVNPDADVLERADFTASNGEVAEIFHLGLGGREFYAVATEDFISSFPLPAQGMTLREWAEDQLTLGDEGEPAGTDWVTIDGSSRLSPGDGVRIVEQRPDPGFGDNFAAPGDPTAVAEIELDGVTYFLAVRSLGGGPTDVIPYRRDDTIPTLDAFVSFSRDQYATNESGGSEGLR